MKVDGEMKYARKVRVNGNSPGLLCGQVVNRMVSVTSTNHCYILSGDRKRG